MERWFVMSHPVTIPSDYGRRLKKDLDSGRVSDEQKLQHFERLAGWAAWLEEKTEVDTIEALQGRVRELERKNRELANQNKKLKEERKVRKARKIRKKKPARSHTDRYKVVSSREVQEDYCWEQHEGVA